jgi:DNA primase
VKEGYHVGTISKYDQAVVSQNTTSPPAIRHRREGVPAKVDLQALKQRVGLTPFSKRIDVDDRGYSKCPFHDGDSETSFHVLETENGAIIGTCFSTCDDRFDAIAFVEKFDKVSTGEAIRELIALDETGEVSAVQLSKAKPATHAFDCLLLCEVRLAFVGVRRRQPTDRPDKQIGRIGRLFHKHLGFARIPFSQSRLQI